MGMDDLKKLRETEGKIVPGANVLTPRESMLDASDVQEKHPDKHLRWVNIRDRQKAESRRLEGYVRLPSDEGGRHLGDELALMGVPREVHERKVAAIKKANEERLNSHRDEMQAMAESVAKSLRDNYGIKVDASRILVDDAS